METRKFVKKTFLEIIQSSNKAFTYIHKYKDGEKITIKGHKEIDHATFSIERTKANGHKCSAIPFFYMPLNATDEAIDELAEMAAENL